MKKIVGGVVGVALLVSILIIVLVKLETIQPGHVGVSIQKCGDGGVNQAPIPTGYYWRQLWCEEVDMYPTFQQTLVLSADDKKSGDRSISVTSSEGLPISVDCSLSFTLEKTKIPALYVRFREDMDEITNKYVRQIVREALQEVFSKYTAEQLYSTHKHQARADAQDFLTKRLGADGLIVNTFTLNAMRVPDQVTHAINAKVAMTQDAQRSEAEVRKTQALASQRVAEAEGAAKAKRATADAEAYYNKTVSGSITQQLIEAQRVQAQQRAIEKWDGKMPQVSGGATPFISLGVK